MFLKGLRENGVPLKYCSWHTNIGSLNSSTVNFAVQERNRSIKSIFALQKRQGALYQVDNGASYFDSSSQGSTMQNFQFRVGARYFPASPVQVSDNVGGSRSNGGAEAFIELQKALNTVGDYRLQTNVNMKNWAIQPLVMSVGVNPLLPEYDYSIQPNFQDAATGRLNCLPLESTTNGFSGTLPPCMFAMASSFETSNGMEISGLNAEEQSDISVMAYWKDQQGSALSGGTSNLEVYTFFDQMLVLRENNVVELIY